MNFPKSARYDKVMIQVNKLFAKEKIKSFPIDPFQIIKNNKWGLLTYSELSQIHGVSVKEIETAFQSEDGYTIYDGVNHTIAYNDTKSISGRIRFTLMHEIAHIYMNHLIDFDETILARSTLTETKYKILENEANSFARNALAPVMVVKDLKINSISDLVANFEMTHTAAKVRLNTLMTDYRNILSQYINFQRDNFKTFIHTQLYLKTCLNCNHHFVCEGAIYCPICSSDRIFKGKGVFFMKYDGYEVNELGRALECPRCGNEETFYDGDHCKVCGLIIINKCSNQHYWNGALEWECGTILDGNARYCIKCGFESTFFQQDLLDDWQKEKKRVDYPIPF
ncbi:ImmA/IrrE family metallo-endopeptidase [Bacillus sp. ISL-57]|uniref:ImmA/IrrE family metallo-endopeptidase n=1 Tax=Bacillus sp. ISL-57 TaxID=2819135 RepID=UPI001BEA9906|nr:ImmA/IrrE family metallo-endopeptidase [Bacillus sp. ISL-57]MBT2718803.1 ImmA/IrrE family metallo-endopeptidase [Bacillus sp. ISL-57]